MKKHFVLFFSPGTFVAEQTEMKIDSWDTDAAVEMARGIKERHGATPYGFRFITRERGPKDLDSRIAQRSGMYYLGGDVLTLEDLEKRNNPQDKILIENMRCNGWARVIENRNSWKWTATLEDEDVVLPFDKSAPGVRASE